MWRKPDEPKVSPSPVTPEPKQVVPAAPVAAVAPAAPVPAPTAREATSPSGHLTSTLVIKGEITGREDLFIDGEVHGKIRLEQGRVTIGPQGRVNADIEAREIVVRGRVKGNLQGRERVEIGQTGCASGDVTTRRILVEDGAEVHGRVEILRVEERPQPKAQQTAALAAVKDGVPAIATPATESATVL